MKNSSIIEDLQVEFIQLNRVVKSKYKTGWLGEHVGTH